MSRRWVVILMVSAVLLVWGWFDGPAARQNRAIDEARALQLQLEPRLAADPRFSAIRMLVSSRPSLSVLGEVPDERALEDLRAMVAVPPSPKFELLFNVRARPTVATRETAE